METASPDELIASLGQSLRKVLEWAERYQPRTVDERGKYDADLDEAEDLLQAIGAWMLLNGNHEIGG